MPLWLAWNTMKMLSSSCITRTESGSSQPSTSGKRPLWKRDHGRLGYGRGMTGALVTRGRIGSRSIPGKSGSSMARISSSP